MTVFNPAILEIHLSFLKSYLTTELEIFPEMVLILAKNPSDISLLCVMLRQP